MFCVNCGANNANDAEYCVECGAKLEQPIVQPVAEPVVEPIAEPVSAPVEEPVVQQSATVSDEEMAVKRIRDNAKLCAILWIVIGVFQCISCVGVVAGGWNIVMGIRGLKFSQSIVPGNRAVYEAYDRSMTNLIIGAVVNFVFGLLIGCALSAFEFFIRDQVLKNRKAFGA